MSDLKRNDQEATYFALHLLMPKQLLDREIGGDRAFTDVLVERIAKKFKVSEIWATIRLQEYFGKGV